jgi:hypothetical protein
MVWCALAYRRRIWVDLEMPIPTGITNDREPRRGRTMRRKQS